MLMFSLAIIVGLALLVWSADKFVDGASNVAGHYGMPPLLIGMIVVGFGTSAPEMVVSILASLQGSPGMAIGNAYGSNITNIALILGATALLMPISVHSQVLRKELPILLVITGLSALALYDHSLSRIEAGFLLLLFAALMFWSIKVGTKNQKDSLSIETSSFLEENKAPIKRSYLMLVGGLILLIISSRVLVYGAIGIAKLFGVPDLIVGLTIVAVGTSLPEFASSIVAARKGEADMAIGNIVGSNLFNTLAVVGASGLIAPISIDREFFFRDIGTMLGMTVLLFLFARGFHKEGRINRIEGAALLASYIGYTIYLIAGTN